MYDYKLQKWVPVVSDPDKWYQHFLDLRDGYVQPDHLGRYIVGSGDKYRKLKEMEEQKPVVNLVSPVAQAADMAKSELTREKEKAKTFVKPPLRKHIYKDIPDDDYLF